MLELMFSGSASSSGGGGFLADLLVTLTIFILLLVGTEGSGRARFIS
jgi:hypothetical protein